jgi:hypothetical protein
MLVANTLTPLDEGVYPPSVCCTAGAGSGRNATRQYSKFHRTVTRNTFCRACVGVPCVLSTRKAYSELEQSVMVTATCSSADRRSVMTTTSTVILLTPSIPRMGDGRLERASAPRTPGAMISSSSDFDWFNLRLLAVAHLLTCARSYSQVGVLMFGTSKYESSAS